MKTKKCICCGKIKNIARFKGCGKPKYFGYASCSACRKLVLNKISRKRRDKDPKRILSERNRSRLRGIVAREKRENEKLMHYLINIDIIEIEREKDAVVALEKELINILAIREKKYFIELRRNKKTAEANRKRKERFDKRDNEINLKIKKCFKCGSIKKWSEFYNDRKSLYGISGSCKVCNSEVIKGRRARRRAKERYNLSNSYVKGAISSNSNLKYKDIPTELVEYKRIQLMSARKIKELK